MKNFLLGFKMTMACLYVSIGIYLLTHPNAISDVFSKNTSLLIGGMLVVFGFFRGYRAWFIERNV